MVGRVSEEEGDSRGIVRRPAQLLLVGARAVGHGRGRQRAPESDGLGRALNYPEPGGFRVSPRLRSRRPAAPPGRGFNSDKEK